MATSEVRAAAPTTDVLVFETGGRTLGLPSDSVIEIVRAVAVTPLPQAPPIALGMINVRGAVVPVLDLRARLGLAPKEIEASDRFILARVSGRTAALRVDAALALRMVDRALIKSDESVGWGAERLAGVTALPDGLLVIVDLEQFLTPTEASALSAALALAFAEEGA